MHPVSMDLMEKHLVRSQVRSDIQYASLLDVGSFDVNGSYREVCEAKGFIYTGLDVRPGPNVDVVSDDPYFYPFLANSFDVVICGNMLHNVAKPWRTIQEMTRVLKPKGLLVVVTIWKWGLNSHPDDYFRCTDEGLRVLFDETDCLRNYHLEIDEAGNTAGSAIKYVR